MLHAAYLGLPYGSDKILFEFLMLSSFCHFYFIFINFVLQARMLNIWAQYIVIQINPQLE